jgi:ATP-dependent Clp protease protease subunit
VEQIIEDGDRDNWFTADEALEYGFVDEIVKHVNDVHEIVVDKKERG